MFVTWRNQSRQQQDVVLSEPPTMKRPNGFESTLKPQNGLYYLAMKTTGTPINTRLDSTESDQGTKAVILPVTMTPTGAKWVTHTTTTYGPTTAKVSV